MVWLCGCGALGWWQNGAQKTVYLTTTTYVPTGRKKERKNVCLARTTLLCFTVALSFTLFCTVPHLLIYCSHILLSAHHGLLELVYLG